MEYHTLQVVVTGGTGALGSAVVGALLEAGASCHIPYRSEAEAQRFAHRDHERVTLAPLAELADEAAVTRFYDGLPALWASIHVAGGFAFAPIAGSDRELLAAQLDSNLVSAYLCSRAAVRTMRRGTAGGRIVNVAARQALEPRLGANLTAYTVSKAALAAFTIALGEEVAAEGILVNAIAPSIMDTAANRASMPDAKFDLWPKVEDVAATIVFLASPRNVATRGAVVPAYGKS